MIEQTALVVSVDAGHAWVVPQQMGGGCGGCSSKLGCSGNDVFGIFRRQPQKIRVLNPVYAHPGDMVVVGMQGRALVLYSLWAYLLPLFGLILAALIGQFAFAWLGLLPELGAVLGGVAGLLGSLRLANHVCSHAFAAAEFQPVVLRAVGQASLAAGIPLVR